MAIEEISQPAFKTSDGALHATREEANIHEALTAAQQQLDEYLKQFEGKAKRSVSVIRNNIVNWEKWKATRLP